MGYGYNVYFTERARNRVICWTPDSGLARVVAGAGGPNDGDQGLRDPYGLAIDGQGHLLIADKLHDRVVRLTNRIDPLPSRDATGARQSRFTGLQHHPAMPTSLSIDTDGALLVAFSDDGTIYRLPASGSLELVLGRTTINGVVMVPCPDVIPPERAMDATLSQPTGAIRLADGSILFIERGPQAVREYHPQRGIRTLFPSAQRGAFPAGAAVPDAVSMDGYHPVCPTSLQLDAKGTLFIADAMHRCIWRVERGTRTMTCVVRTPVVQPDFEGGPAAMAFGPDGTLWVLDYASRAVRGFSPTTQGPWRPVAAACTGVNGGALLCYGFEGAGVVCGR